MLELAQAYELGYDASDDVVPERGFAIHHPSGNVARVSSFNQTACASMQTSM